MSSRSVLSPWTFRWRYSTGCNMKAAVVQVVSDECSVRPSYTNRQTDWYQNEAVVGMAGLWHSRRSAPGRECEFDLFPPSCRWQTSMHSPRSAFRDSAPEAAPGHNQPPTFLLRWSHWLRLSLRSSHCSHNRRKQTASDFRHSDDVIATVIAEDIVERIEVVDVEIRGVASSASRRGSKEVNPICDDAIGSQIDQAPRGPFIVHNVAQGSQAGSFCLRHAVTVP